MKLPRVIAIVTSLQILFSCTPDYRDKTEQDPDNSQVKFVTIDGLWKSTPGTILDLGHIKLRPVVHISGSLQNKISAQGCFTSEGLFVDYWGLADIEYDEATGKVVFHDHDGSTFIGKMNARQDSISGMVYSGEADLLVPEDKLDFIRALDLDIENFFFPRAPEKDGSIRFAYEKPEMETGGLETKSVYEFVSDSLKLSSFMGRVIRQDYGRLESLLILKGQDLILEEYFFGYNREQTHNIHSCTKSIVSLLMGAALNDAGIPDVHQAAGNFFPGMDLGIPMERNDLTLHHVLTMTAGLRSDEGYLGYEQKKLAEFILRLPSESAPGELFRYNSECPYLLGSIIYANTGKQPDDFAKETLFGPLGISDYTWEEDKGIPRCHSDLHMRPIDMAKIGLLVLNDGRWKTQQIIPKEWIRASALPHAEESEFFSYGYQWWLRSSQNKSWWKEDAYQNGPEHEMLIALGFGGQYIFIIKDLSLVIVVTSSDYNEGNGQAFKKIPMVIEDLAPLFEPLLR